MPRMNNSSLELAVAADRTKIIAQLRTETDADDDAEICERADLISNKLRQRMLDFSRQTGTWAFPVNYDDIVLDDGEVGNTIVHQPVGSSIGTSEVSKGRDVTDRRFEADELGRKTRPHGSPLG